MKRYWCFVKKEFRHIFRDYRTLIILFGLPVAQLLIFGYVVSNELKDIRVAVCDRSKDDITREITEKIFSSGYFILDGTISDSHEIGEKFREGDVRQVIVFEPDFGEKLRNTGTADIQLIADASDANTAKLVVNYTSGIIMNYMEQTAGDMPVPLRIKPKLRFMYNEELEGVFMFVPGTMALILMLVSSMMTSISIAREKELGTMENLLVSPLGAEHIIFGKVTPYVLISFLNAVVIIILGYFVFGLPLHGSIALLLLENILYISMALSLGIFISTVSGTQQVAMMISALGLLMPTMLLSGFIFPVENMPPVLQGLSTIMPARWFITILKNIMIKGTGILYVWKETVILLGMTTVFVVLSIKRFKLRLE